MFGLKIFLPLLASISPLSEEINLSTSSVKIEPLKFKSESIPALYLEQKDRPETQAQKTEFVYLNEAQLVEIETLLVPATAETGQKTDAVSTAAISTLEAVERSTAVENEIAQARQPVEAVSTTPDVKPSRALNLTVLRAIKKPKTERLLDTVFSAPIQQQPANPSFWTQDFMTGTWGGWRDRLYEQGIDLYAAQILDSYSQPSGGLEQDSTLNSLTLLGADLYTDRMGWWPNGQIHITAAFIEAKSLARESIGALNSVAFNDAPKDGMRMFEVWYGHKFAERKGEVRIGTLYPFVRIASNQVSSIFSNTAFDYPHFLGTTPSLGMSVPYAAAPFGLQFNYNLSPELFLIGQLSDGFQDPSGGIDNYRNIEVALNGDEGMEGIVELSYKPNQRPGSTGLPGNYKIGAQFHTGKFNVNDQPLTRQEDGTGAFLQSTETKRGNAAFYLIGDQMLYAEPGQRTQGVSGFFKLAFTPYQDVNTVSFHASTGLAYEGLLPGRDRDVVGLAVAHTRISEGLRSADRQCRDNPLCLTQTTEVRDAETVAELLYAAEITPWWVLTGSVQHIINPGGYGDRDNATIFGLSNRFSF